MAGVLARLQVQDVDAPASSSSATTTTLFVRCKQKALAPSALDGSSGTVRLPALQLDVAEGHALWRGEVTEEHKPIVLDCAASEYLNALESVFSARCANVTSDGGSDDTKCAFVYKWSRKSGVLTLIEESASGFTMKYTSLTLTPVSDNDSEKQAIWTSLLQETVDVGAHTAQETTRQKTRIEALEKLLKEKDAVLETALLAKQQLEDQLFEGFCAVLNAKKDEIQRLQYELAVAQVQTSSLLSNSNGKSTNGKSTSSKKSRQPRAAKAKGAKLKRKMKVKDEEEDDEEERQGSSSEEDEEEADSQDDDDSDSHGDDDDDDSEEVKRPSRSRRAKRDAIEVYSQLSSSIHSLSQVCNADDMLSDLDAIMKQEVEANDAIQVQADNNNSNSNKAKRPRALTSTLSTRRTHEKKRKSESSSQDEETKESATAKSHAKKATTVKPKSAPAPRPPPAAAPVDLEEEDILDMLA